MKKTMALCMSFIIFLGVFQTPLYGKDDENLIENEYSEMELEEPSEELEAPTGEMEKPSEILEPSEEIEAQPSMSMDNISTKEYIFGG